MIDKVKEEAIKILIEKHLEEFKNILFQKQREMEAFGGFVK